tara:strand:+ start:160 stop:732 length:573 start_codon:yes stop_codon:yes gene_type:complete
VVKLDKIYTKGGDKGETSLGNGDRVKKHDPRVETYGEIEEANALIGCSLIYSSNESKNSLQRIQNDLFDLGADLCIPDSSIKKKLKVSEIQVEFLENEIDNMNLHLGKLTSFILPGGSKASSFLHLTRCVIRRAERKLTSLMEKEDVNNILLKYLNRLSDFLFVIARYENKNYGDVLWEPGKVQKEGEKK